jgi:DNA-binding protein Fis
MKKFSAVLVNLQNPREKVWGILLSIQSSGVTVRGIDLNSFDDWSRSVGRGDSEMALSTMFLPIHRVERINQDESVGNIRSLADLFEERVQKDVWTHLGLESGPAAGDRVRRSDWMSLEDAETDYLERVLEDCDGDRAAAAEILGLTEAALNDKLS